MLKSIFTAVYTAITLEFLKRIFNKLKSPLEHEVHIDHRDSSDNWYVMCKDRYINWFDSKEEAQVFVWNACARAKSLCTKLKIVEDGGEHCLVSADSIPGLELDELVGINQTIDEME